MYLMSNGGLLLSIMIDVSGDDELDLEKNCDNTTKSLDLKG